MSVATYFSLALFVQAGSYPRQESVIGRTYPISERDAMLEVEEAAAGADLSIETFGDPSSWTALEMMDLPKADESRRRTVVPLHALEFSVPDGKGGILYPEGFAFNPLDYGTLPGRMIVTTTDRVEWARREAGPLDMVLVSGSNRERVLQFPGESIFVLSPLLGERLGVDRAPVILWQEGASLVLHEIDASTIPTDADLEDRTVEVFPIQAVSRSDSKEGQ